MNLQTFVSILGVVVIIGLYLYFYVYGIFDNFRRKEWKIGVRILWFLLIVLFVPLGLLIYFFVNNRKKWGWFFIGFHVILILLIFFAAFFTPFLLQKEREKIKERYESRLEEKVKPSEKVSKEEVANWKTYQDEEYKFEIKYPENYKVNQVNKVIIFPSQARIEIKIDSSSKSSAEWVATGHLKWEQILINNIEGLKAKIKKSDRYGNLKGAVVLSHNGRIFTISLLKENPVTEDEIIIFDQILSTLRFLE